MEKPDLLKAMSEVQAGWEALIAALGPEGLERPGAAGEWRVRDVLAHFNGWDRWQMVQLRCAFTGETPSEAELTGGIPYPPNDDLHEDAMNAMFIAGARGLSSAEILRHWREISALRVAWVSAADQAQLDALIGEDWGGGPRILRLASEVPSATRPRPAWQSILDQVEHQREHLQNVRAWLGG